MVFFFCFRAREQYNRPYLNADIQGSVRGQCGSSLYDTLP